MRFKTKMIVLMSLFMAINIILTRALSFYIVSSIRIDFGNVPIIIAGIILGPIAGAVTGGLSDLVGVLLIPAPTGSAFFPGFTLSKILVGVIPALLTRYFKGSLLLRIVLSVVLTEVICSVILDTIWLSMLLNKGILVLLPARLIAKTAIMAAEIPIICIVIKRLKKLDILNSI